MARAARGGSPRSERKSDPGSLDLLRQVMELFERSGVAELEFEDPQCRIRLARSHQPPVPGEAGVVELRAHVSGAVAGILVEEGATVVAGQPLIRLVPR